MCALKFTTTVKQQNVHFYTLYRQVLSKMTENDKNTCRVNQDIFHFQHIERCVAWLYVGGSDRSQFVTE